MKLKTLQQLSALQHQPSQIRNICILAHVDHGKTTLADALVASNGIISKRNAGKMRYMDSRADEQERGITMKSSAITLAYEKKSNDSCQEQQQYLVNLIDSPGHVDFSSEVTTAVRLCDGAIIVVDVVEGVCPQTNAVLRQAWLENIRPMLVLNKVDRLITELKLTPMEAYFHLIQVLEQVNLITNQLFTSEAMEKTSMEPEDSEGGRNDPSRAYDWTVVEDEEDNKSIFFAPNQGNVVFASALDGWGFTIEDFASMYSVKLGVKKEILFKTMWGDYYLNMKSKRILKGAQIKGKKPLFVQFALENIWSAYDAVLVQKDSSLTEKIVKSLNLTIDARDARHKDSRVLLHAIMTQWLPLAEAVLAAVTRCIPSPLNMTGERVEKLICSQNLQFTSLPQPTQALKKHFRECHPDDEVPTIIYISKMFPMERRLLPQSKARPLTEEELQIRRDGARKRHAEILARRSAGNEQTSQTMPEPLSTDGFTYVTDSKSEAEEKEDEHVFLAFARVFSGTARKGKTVFFLGPKHDPAEALRELQNIDAEEFILNPDLKERFKHITPVVLKDLYLLMGREVESLEEVPAGNVLGIGGIEEHVLKSGTLSSTVACPAFTDMYFDASPIIRVAVESAEAGDMSQLVHGLHLLNQADPCVEVRIQDTGEHVIIAAGEVHLERCIDDLIQRYAKVEVNVSKPIVPFRETVVLPPKMDMVNESIEDQKMEDDSEDTSVMSSTADRYCHLQIRAAPLPGNIPRILTEHATTLKALHRFNNKNMGETSNQTEVNVKYSLIEEIHNVKQLLKEEFSKAGGEWSGTEENIWSFGPRNCGPNILINRIGSYERQSVWQPVETLNDSKLADFDSSIVNGFQMTTLAGPLCEETIHGVCFIVEDWWFGDKKITAKNQDDSVSISRNQHPSSGHKNVLSDSSSNSLSKDVKSLQLSKEHKSDKVVYGQGTIAPLDFDKSNYQVGIYGPLSGQLISTMKDGCRRAFQAQPQRLMVAMYKCEVQAKLEVLGKMHAVLSKRYGQVLSEEMLEGTDVFTVTAALPVIESFGFAEDIRKKTSGLASPQLRFSHWEVIAVDPFWVPTTEEEYMHYGEKADAENRARLYMNQVRKRKGLRTDEKIVEFAEKQRTLTKMK